MPLVESRYAKALIDVALINNTVDSYLEDLKEWVKVYESLSDLRFFLGNPEIKKGFKKETLKMILSQKISPELLNFLMLLVDKDRSTYVPGILTEYQRISDMLKNILSIQIYASTELDITQMRNIEEKYKSIYNASLVVSAFEVDESLIGGVKVVVGDKIYDGSIKGHLDSLKQVLQS